jgi:MSHA biogenesis protein MshK
MKVIVAAIVLGSAVGQAAAQALSDPMRPANVLEGAAEVRASAAGPVLQSVLISRERKVAVINGKAMKIGDRMGEATLVSIEVAEVILESRGTLQVLKLYPNAQKRTGAQSGEGS